MAHVDVTIYHDIGRPLQIHRVQGSVVVEFKQGLLVHRGRFQSQFILLISIFRQPEVLHHFCLRVVLPVDRVSHLLSQLVKFSPVLRDVLVDESDDRVVKSERVRKPVLCERARNVNFISVFNVEHEQFFLQFNSLQHSI